MNGLRNTQPTHAYPHGALCIDIDRALYRLNDAAEATPMDKYLVSCASVQFWADLLTLAKLNGVLGDTTTQSLEQQLRYSESKADHAAQLVLGMAVAGPQYIDYPKFANIELHVSTSIDILSKVLHLPMPECCGYDLADLSAITEDVHRLIAHVRLDREFLIVGLRTGGAYLAPLWKAVLTGLGAANAHWCTVRPAECAMFDGLETASNWLVSRSSPVVVVVDDRPDTGATMQSVAGELLKFGIDLWFSSVGKLWHGSTEKPALTAPVCPTATPSAARLWECLLPSEHSEFIGRLRDVAGIHSLSDEARLIFRCPQGEARYGSGRAWLPWSDSRILKNRRPLINPRKTPITIQGPNGKDLFHLRFIGEGVFGRAEFYRVQNMRLRAAAWLVDGYVVTADIGVKRSFQEQFHAEDYSGRTNLLLQAANWLASSNCQSVGFTFHSPVVMTLERRWSAILDIMLAFCNYDYSQEISAHLRAFLASPVPWPGRTGMTFRSSLRYGSGGWHWQVDDTGRLHRFQLETNWGDISFYELEVGVFILENRLAIEDAMQLILLCGLAWISVREILSLAALTIAESRVRSIRKLTSRGRILLREDFHQLIKVMYELTEIRTSSWE